MTQDELKQLVHYDPMTGLFTRLPKKEENGYDARWNREWAGRVARIANDDGIVINIKQKMYPAHNLAWLYMYGEYLERRIEHIDGDKFNNAISNLRKKHIISCAERAAQIAERKAQRRVVHAEKIRLKAERKAALEAKRANKNACITQDELKALLDFDPATGIFTHKIRPGILPRDKAHNALHAGKVAGNGLAISLNGKLYGIRYLASLYQHGANPPKKQVEKKVPVAEKKAKPITKKITKIPTEAAKQRAKKIREDQEEKKKLAVAARLAQQQKLREEKNKLVRLEQEQRAREIREEKEEKKKLAVAARLAQQQKLREEKNKLVRLEQEQRAREIREEKEEKRKLEVAARLEQEQRAKERKLEMAAQERRENEIRVAREQRLAIAAKKAADELAAKQAAASQITDKRAEIEARSRALMQAMGLLSETN